MTADSARPNIPTVPRSVLNVAILAVLLLCMFGSYFGWGWGVIAAVAAFALLRPWLPSAAPSGGRLS